jgi:hypothetical protein
MSQLLAVYDQKTFDIRGTANGDIRLALDGGIINDIQVDLETEDGIFVIEDLEKSLATLPGGGASVRQLERRLGRKELLDELVKALRKYPYERGSVAVAWEPTDNGTVLLDLKLKGKTPETGARYHFKTVNIPVRFHGIGSLSDLFSIDKILEKMKGEE